MKVNSNPLVSIMIPVYNREDMIESCIKSASSQSYKNIEIIVVDNNSTDNTLVKCINLSKIDSRIRVYSNKSNIGPVKNWKKCIDLAQGEYGKILFSDDIIFQDFIERAVKLMDAEISFVVSSAKIGPSLDQSITSYDFSNKFTKKSLNIKIPRDEYIESILLGYGALVSPGAALFRVNDLKKSFMIEVPSPTLTNFSKHGAGPDLLLFLLTAVKYKYVAHIVKPLVFFREHGGSTTVKALKDKSWSIRACYTQARVWFAENYLDNKMLSMLIARAYLIEVVVEREYKYLFRPLSFTKKYVCDLKKFSFRFFLTSLPKLLFSAIKYRLIKKVHS